MSSVELSPEKRITPQPGAVKVVEINLFDPHDPSGILKQPPEADDEALMEMNQIIGVQPALLGS